MGKWHNWKQSIGYWLATLLMLAIIMAVALPALAHTEQERAEFHSDWSERAYLVRASGWLTLDLLVELEHFGERHPTPEYTTSPRREVGGNVEQWRGLVAEHFAPDNVETMMCLMVYESGGDPNAKNPTSSARGLFQIMASIWAPEFGVSYADLFDPVINTRIARGVYDRQGYGAWSPYNRGLCHGL